MTSPTVAGVLPICHTPFGEDDRIDHLSLKRQIDWAFQQGADGVCTGMVSEVLRLTVDERYELTEKLVEYAAGRGVVVASVGCDSLPQALQLARRAEDAGCHALMAIPPLSTSLPNSELEYYFATLADSVALPLIVQDASAYVGQEIDLAICARLLERYGPEKILFKPEAAPTGPKLSELRRLTGGRARVFEGSGGMLLVDSFRRGIAGTMPGMEFLDGIIALWRALQAGDEERAYRIYLPICALVALQLQAGLDGFLAVEKYLLVKRGLFATDRRRRPNAWQLDAETTAEIDRLFRLLQSALAVGKK